MDHSLTLHRLNDNFLRKDLEVFLCKQMDSGIDQGSFIEVREWLATYYQRIEAYKREIVDGFSILFPKAVIRLGCGYDDNSTFFVEIYGINHSKEEYEKAHMLSEKFSYDDCEGCYLIIPSFKNLEITQKHYPEIYEEYVKKNSSNIP